MGGGKMKEHVKRFFLKSKNFLRRGGYSVVITAVVLAVIILINFLVGELAKKVNLEFDMTENKSNSMSKENIKFLKEVDKEVSIIVCARKSDYTPYLLAYSQDLYQTDGDQKYFDQTVKFLEKYDNLNKKINVRFIDMQSAEYTEISQKYSDMNIIYGDIIVSCTHKNNNTRSKKLGFYNIYTLMNDAGFYQVAGNNLETSLTSAISYVTSENSFKTALYIGHSKKDYSAAYVDLLENNNYDVEVISDPVLSKISDEFDSIAILSPDTDFIDSEITAISDFLKNGEKGGKGLIVFGDAANPVMPNFNLFLSEWGITVNDGLLVEMNQNMLPDPNGDITAMFSTSNGNNDFTDDTDRFVTGNNIPISVDPEYSGKCTAMAITSASDTSRALYLDESGNTVSGRYDDRSFDTLIESKTSEYEKASYIFMFSSIDFIASDWAETSSLSNKELSLQVSDIASGNVAKNISFVTKEYTNPSYISEVNEESNNRVKNIFVIALPLIVVAWGIIVFIRRRNSK